MKVHLNKNEIEIGDEDELSNFLDSIKSSYNAEVWMTASTHETLCLLKKGESMFLMYLRNPDDVGVVSKGNGQASKLLEFQLANGQIDEHPESWCVEPSQAYKALNYFFINIGGKFPNIEWQVA